MDKIINLIKHLKAYYIILIENDLYYELDTEKILSKYCLLSEYTRSRLGNSLITVGYSAINEALNSFYETFSALDHDEEKKVKLMPDELREYLKKIGKEAILNDFPLTLLSDTLAADTDDEFKEALLRFGIFQINDGRYSKFFTLFDQLPNIHVNYYKSMPVPEELDVLESEIDQGIRETDSVFYLGIIDKKLGSDAGDEQGKSFIEGDLWRINQLRKFNFIGFLYTSDPVESSPSSFKDYFISEIQKGDNLFEERVVNCLLNCAYVSIFNSLSLDRQTSTQHVFDISIKNQNNIKNIIDKAITEGVSLLDSVKNWFDLAVQFKLDEISSHRVSYDASLSKLLNDASINGHEGLSIFGNDLQKINSFELFDNGVTCKSLPILPGNIFMFDNEYYILIGQVCDILLRKDNTRGAKIAEFLKAVKKPYQDGHSNDKFIVNVDDSGIKRVVVEHFEDAGKYYSLEVEVTSKNTYYADFEILDLCSYTNDGVARIDISVDTPSEKSNVFTDEKNNYFFQLRDEFTRLHDNKTKFPYPFELKNQYLLEKQVFDASNTEINFNINRVSTLKGRFYDSLYQQYLNYKGRIDLNMIENAIFTPSNIDLTVRFSVIGQDEMFKVKLMISKGEKSHIMKSDILDVVSPKFVDLINSLDDKILLSVEGQARKEYTLNQDGENWILELKVAYLNNKHEVIYAPDSFVKYGRLFGQKNTDVKCLYLDTNEKFDLDEEGKIQLVDIVRGIKFSQNNAILKFENGRITYTIVESEQ